MPFSRCGNARSNWMEKSTLLWCQTKKLEEPAVPPGSQNTGCWGEMELACCSQSRPAVWFRTDASRRRETPEAQNLCGQAEDGIRYWSGTGAQFHLDAWRPERRGNEL